MTTETIEPLTLADFEAAGWREIIKGAAEKTCLHYAELFQQKFVEAEKAGNAVRARACGELLILAQSTIRHRHVKELPLGRWQGSA